jgi:hypothetical protein
MKKSFLSNNHPNLWNIYLVIECISRKSKCENDACVYETVHPVFSRGHHCKSIISKILRAINISKTNSTYLNVMIKKSEWSFESRDSHQSMETSNSTFNIQHIWHVWTFCKHLKYSLSMNHTHGFITETITQHCVKDNASFEWWSQSQRWLSFMILSTFIVTSRFHRLADECIWMWS